MREVELFFKRSDAFFATTFDVDAYLEHVDETYARLGLPVDATPANPAVAQRPALAVEAGLGGGQL